MDLIHIKGKTRNVNFWNQQEFMDYVYQNSYLEYVSYTNAFVIRIWI